MVEKTKRLLFSSIASIVLRGGVAVVGLVAIRLTRSFLSEEEFVVYGLAMFAVGLNAAIVFPVNRRFWANYSSSVFHESIAFATILTVFCLPGILVSLLFLCCEHLNTANTKLFFLTIACVVFAVAQQKLRFSYGSCVMQKLPVVGQLYLLVGAGLECLSAFWCQFTDNSLFMRLVGGSTVCLILLRFADKNREGKQPVKRNKGCLFPEVIKKAFSTVISKTGIESIFASVLLTIASMGERVVVPISFPQQNGEFRTADYMLIAMYATAYLSILMVLIDLSRPLIFQNGKWQQNALKVAFIMTCFSATCGLVVGSVGWWVGQEFYVIPTSVNYLYWCSLIGRMTALCVLNVVHIDLWMSGYVKRVIPPWLLIVGLTVLPFVTNMFLSGAFMSWIVTIAVSMVVFIEYFLFLSRYFKSKNIQIDTPYLRSE